MNERYFFVSACVKDEKDTTLNSIGVSSCDMPSVSELKKLIMKKFNCKDIDKVCILSVCEFSKDDFDKLFK